MARIWDAGRHPSPAPARLLLPEPELGFDADVPRNPLPAPAADPEDGLLVSCSSLIIREFEGFNCAGRYFGKVWV